MDRIFLKVHYENRKDVELNRCQQFYNFFVYLHYLFMFVDEDKGHSFEEMFLYLRNESF